ncbi:N-acetyltransferase [Inquilinus sp. CAU 1745]|uniref:GNAT family N-acetyltransferase n=1 Tax=Inquilinus sp. CAU 1745 TaxID=3140369 RepID=UPI00325B9DD2
MFHIAAESAEDSDQIERLLDEAFGSGRQAKISYRYREDVPPVESLSYVARLDDGEGDREIVGSIRYWPITVGQDSNPALLLGPLAIAPRLQGRGIGASLTFQTLDLAAWGGHRLVLLVGDLAYYKRFGFLPAAPHGIAMPDEKPERLLVTELVEGVLASYAGDIVRAERQTRDRRVADPRSSLILR